MESIRPPPLRAAQWLMDLKDGQTVLHANFHLY